MLRISPLIRTISRFQSTASVDLSKIRRPNTGGRGPAVVQWKKGEFARHMIGWGTLFAGFFSWAIYQGRSAQIKYSPLFKGVMFTIRQDEEVRKWIGEDVKESSLVHGYINHIKGRADISFDIQGSEGKGHVELKASKRQKNWFVERLKVECAGEVIADIS